MQQLVSHQDKWFSKICCQYGEDGRRSRICYIGNLLGSKYSGSQNCPNVWSFCIDELSVG